LAPLPSGAQEPQKSWAQTMVSWAQDQFQDIARTQGINQLLGPTVGEPLNSAIDVGQGLNTLVNVHGTAALNQGMNGNYEATQQYLNQQVPNDLLNMVLPGPLADIIPNAQKFYDQLQQWGTNIVDGVNAIGDKISGAIDNLTGYFSPAASSGLEPGSPEAQLAQAGNLGTPQNIATTLANGAYQTGSAPGAANPNAAPQVADAAQDPTQGSADEDDDEDYGPAPPVAALGPNSERDTDYSSVTVTPVPMTSTDPNSCIKTSNALGVGSVSIDCDSSAAQEPAESSPDSAEDDALLAAANQRMNAQEAGQAQALTQSQNMANAAAMQYMAQSQVPRSMNIGKGGGACSAPGLGSGALRCENIVAVGICDRARKLEACMSAAISSCGGCGACISQAQSMIASARATAASACN
jgi:hypothetical protein